MNAKMPELKACFEAAGFREVRTLLSSGNVVFTCRAAPTVTIERRAERAMRAHLDRSFDVFVRSVEDLQAFVESDPFDAFDLAPSAKRVVTFLRTPADPGLRLPPARDGAGILKVSSSEVLAAYVPGPKGPVFMALLERTFGTGITTRTLDTVRKCAAA